MKWSELQGTEQPQKAMKWSELQQKEAVSPEQPQMTGFMAGLTGQGRVPPEQAQAMGAETAAQFLEPAATMATSMIAEPIAGLAGLTGLFTSPKEAARRVQATREALTYRPRTKEGTEALRSVGEAVKPVGEALQWVEKKLGDTTYEMTESPALAAAATTIPTAVMEVLGLGTGKRAAKTMTGMEKLPKRMRVPTKVKEKAITKSLLEAAPEIDQIKDVSRAIYKEIDNLDVVAKPEALANLVTRVSKRAGRVNPVLTPKSAEAIRLFKSELDDIRPRRISDFDELRQMAQIAAQSPDAADARIGAMMIDEIDDFMDNLKPSAFSGPDVKTVGDVGKRYKAARGLWGRARRAELINDAFSKAERQASGFENGIRIQLRQILKNKKRARFFTKDELAAMDDVVKGTGTQNILKLVGRLGFSEGAATNVLGGLVGIGVLGPGAPVIGQISRKIAQKTTQQAANRMESLIRSGAKGRDIARAYLQSVPKKSQNIQELSDMLLASGSEIDDLLASANKITKEAAEIARARRLFGQLEAAGTAAAAAPGIITEEQQ